MLDRKHDYCCKFIAFLDMLGFKNLIKEKECDYLLKVFEKIRYPFKVSSKETDTAGKEIEGSQKDYRINSKIISDSICLYIEATDNKKLMILIMACSIIQWELLNCDTPIFVRGGIVKGYIYSDGDVIFGEGLTRAYLLEEGNAKYPRIIMTGDILHPLRTHETRNGETTVERLVFKDFDGFYTVDYFSRLKYYRKQLGACDRVVRYVNNILGTTTDSSLREKYNYFIGKLASIGIK